jgi:DNA polymerase-1
LVAILAGETWLIKAFENPEFDIHADTQNALGLTRSVAKNVNFAIINWAGADKIALVAGCDKQTAEGFIQRARARVPRILRYQYELLDHAKEKGWIATPFSRRGYFKVMFKDGTGEVKANKIIAFPHQSCGGSMMTRTLRRARDAGLRLVATVHDELVVSEQKESDMKTLEDVMGAGHPELMKWGCPSEVGAGQSWAEAKK